MLSINADRRKLLLYAILKRKTMSKGKLPSGMHIRVQEIGETVSELMEDWVHDVRGRYPGHILQHRSLLVLDIFTVILCMVCEKKWVRRKWILYLFMVD
jgi:hypothetical protein